MPCLHPPLVQRAMIIRSALLLSAALLWWVIATQYFELAELLTGYAKFLVLGLTGAIFANSTGAGGGVVFIPAFNALEFLPAQSIATSFAIQCFGMTAGALTWARYRRDAMRANPQWQHLPRFLWLCAPFSLLGLTLVGLLDWRSPDHLHTQFSVFSVVLALSLFTTLRWAKLDRTQAPASIDAVALPLISFLGGIVTAWLSVGVGELIAVYLLWRRFDVRLAVAVAVIVSAISVWLAGSYLALAGSDIVWPVVMFAGPAAVCGGIIARRLATWVDPIHLKVFFASWILVVGLAGVLPSVAG